MIIRGSKLIGGSVLFNFETGVAQNLNDDGTLETNEEISSLSSQSSGFVNSPSNPDSPFNPVNFVETGDDTGSEEVTTSSSLSPRAVVEWEPGIDPFSEVDNGENTGENTGDGQSEVNTGGSSGGSTSGHHSNGFQGANGEDFFNPEDEIEVPLVLGLDQPEKKIKGQTWLTFNEHGQGVISVYNGQEWSKVGEELQPLDIGSY